MKEKLTRNIGLKIISIILAALLWLVITNVDDPIKQKSFDNVSVEILHESAITNLGQVYEILEGKTVDITFAARRSIADELTVSDFKVTADFEKLSDVHAVQINISCPGHEDEVTIKSGLQVMKVNLEKLEVKAFMVNVVQKGEPAKGWYAYEKNAKTLIRVSGPKTKIEKIAQVVVEADVTDLSGNFSQSEQPKALDADGKEIDDSNLVFSQYSVNVDIFMYKTKEINLKIKTTGKPADGYIMSNIEYAPKTIVIAADDSILEDINELEVSADITDAAKNIESVVNLQDELDKGIVLVGENKTTVINITIEKAVTKELSIWPGDLNVKNKPEGFDLTYLTTGPITVKVIGPAKEIEDITKGNLKPYIDLSSCSIGTYTVDVNADFKGYTTLANYPMVNINLNQ